MPDDVIDAARIRTWFPFAGGGGSVTISPTLRLTLPNGRVYTFEWHRYLGPTFLRADGEALAHYPSERHPMWRAYSAWCDQGRRVDPEGNCLWLEPCGAVRALLNTMDGIHG